LQKDDRAVAGGAGVVHLAERRAGFLEMDQGGSGGFADAETFSGAGQVAPPEPAAIPPELVDRVEPL